MKITNHQKGNYAFDSSHDGSIMYGTVEVSHKEWCEIVKYLHRVYSRATTSGNTYTRDALSHVFDWTLKNHAQDEYVCIGVEATRLMFKRFNLPRYKHQNYRLHLAHNRT